MDLRGRKITVHDMTLRDGMHPKRHLMSLEQMIDIATGLDEAGVPVEKRIKMYRLAEKLALESADTISDIHGGGSPAAHRVTIFRETNTSDKKKSAKRLAGIND